MDDALTSAPLPRRRRPTALAAGAAVFCWLGWLGSVASAAADAGDKTAVPLPKWARGLDERIEWISTLVEEDENAGLGWRPNERCPDRDRLERARALHRDLVNERRDWLAERRRRADELCEAPFVHVRTRHFELAYGLSGDGLDRPKGKPLAGALRYAARLEDEWEFIRSSLDVLPQKMESGRRHEIFLVEEHRHAEKIATRVLGNEIRSGYRSVRIGHPVSGLVLEANRKYLPDDRTFHQALVHLVSHLVVHDVGEYRQWLHDRHGWLYEGLAYHDTIRRFGPPVITCRSDEIFDLKHWLSPYFEANVLKAVKTRRDPDPRRVLLVGVDDLMPKERQFAWSYVDFLLWKEPRDMAHLLELTKGERRLDSIRALEEAYGLDLETFAAEWKRFVLEHYSRRPRKGPTPPRERPRDR